MAATRAAPGPAKGIAGPAYAAFISYSRGADARLAPRLESALERFAKPWYRLRMVRVFRDDSDLASNPGLWSSLTGALDRAHFFVLLASPAAAASAWVGREVEYWLAHQGADRMLIVLSGTGGAAGTPRAVLELWDVARRARVGAEPLLERTADVFRSRIAFAPDGRRLAISGLGAPLVFDLDVADWAARATRLAAGAA